MEINPVIPQVC